MALSDITRLSGNNQPGLCYIDVIPVEHVLSLPEKINNNISGSPTLAPDTGWIRITTTRPGTLFTESWSLESGDQLVTAMAEGSVPKDQLTLLTDLFNLKTQRFLVIFHGMNGDKLIMGSPEEPAQLRTTARERGLPGQSANRYRLQAVLVSNEPTPFFNGTVVVPTPPGCPTLAALLSGADWGTAIEPNLSPTQLTDAFASLLSGADWDDDIQPALSTGQLLDALAALIPVADWDTEISPYLTPGQQISARAWAITGADWSTEIAPLLSAPQLEAARLQFLQLLFGFAGTDDTTVLWTITAEQAGSFETFTNDGGSGTITFSQNGDPFGALPTTMVLDVGDTVQFKRTTSSAQGWVNLAY